MSELQDRYIRFDWAIKRLLRQKANCDVLEGFLTVFFGEPIKIIEILESEGNHLLWDDAQWNRIDLKVEKCREEPVFVRIQNMRELYYRERLLYGIPAENLECTGIKGIYCITILYFDIGKGTDYLYHRQNRFIGVHTHDELQVNVKERNAFVTRTPASIFPEYILIRVNEFNDVAVTPLEEWMRYLKEGIIRPDTTAPGLNEAREKLRYYSMTPQERRAYDEHLNAVMIQNDVLSSAKEEGKMEGRLEGIAEGRMDERLKNAKGMKNLGIASDKIAEITGLSSEDVEKL